MIDLPEQLARQNIDVMLATAAKNECTTFFKTTPTRIVAGVERWVSMMEELEAVTVANLQRATRLRQSIFKSL